jgi:hypothetical protein
MPRTSTVRKGGNNLVSEITNTFSNIEPLSYVCAAVIILYMAVAKPSNTPSFFGHPAFKAVLFIVVFFVTMMDPVIGILFGLAMVLSISYSHKKNSQEGFISGNNEVDEDDEQYEAEAEEDNVCTLNQPCLHNDPNNNTCFEKSNGVCPAGTTDQYPSENKCISNKPCLHNDPNNNTCFEKSNGVCPAGTTDQF